MAATVFFAAFVATLLAAALQDLRQRRIGNRFPVLLVALFVLCLLWRGEAEGLLSHVTSFTLVFAAGAALFGRGLLGGGDVKLMAAAALWFNASLLPAFILAVTFCGGALAVAVIGRSLLLPVKAEAAGQLCRHAKSVPYGVAIAAGAIIVGGHSLPFQ